MTDRRPQWHDMRFDHAPHKASSACTECGRVMYLPPSKVDMYKRCSPECAAAYRARTRIDRSRTCETCAKEFDAHHWAISKGGAKYCSRQCNPATHLFTPEALTYAQERKREEIDSGRLKFPRGPDNKQWRGGPKATLQRLIESGEAARRTRDYRKRNPHKVHEFEKRRAGRKLGKLPYGTIPRIGKAQKWKCAICRCGIKRGYHVDHIMPLKRGGEHVPTNIQLLCQTCNVRKNAKDPIAYMQSLGRLL